jgi:hypothetical protein
MLKKEEFLVLASEWYEEKYSLAFKHYLSKGKYSPMALPCREDL